MTFEYGQKVKIKIIWEARVRKNDDKLLKPNGAIISVVGKGMSFSVKKETLSMLQKIPREELIILDPKQEYTPIARKFKGQVVYTELGLINPFDKTNI
ncbi:hypothetical protein ACRPK2_10445 [Lactococcus garvieae]|uniref:hypothetical protein n=1 Tax=Lactococcus garvieae TaxID=1363 RepID=UPI003D788E67